MNDERDATEALIRQAFDAEDFERAATLAVECYGAELLGFLIAQMFFGLWLLPLGYLVVRSGYVPRVLGVLLALGGVGYLVDLFARFLALGAAERISPFVLGPALVGEVAFVAWLLVKTVRVPEQDARVPAAA